jgi:hypothetical protein
MKDKWNVLTQRYPGQNNLLKIIEVSRIIILSELSTARKLLIINFW